MKTTRRGEACLALCSSRPGGDTACIFIAAGSGEEPPDEFRVLRLGENRIKYGPPYILDEAGARQAIAKFEEAGHDLVIDYEHQTEAVPPIEAPAAGWVEALTLREDGLYARARWTPRAVEYFKNREYRYFSPVFFFNRRTRHIMALKNIGITNDPKLNELTPLAAKNDNRKENDMDPKELCKVLGLAEDATEEAVLKAVEALKTPAAPPAEAETVKEVCKALGLDPEKAGKSELVASIHALKQRPEPTEMEKLSAKVASLEGVLAARDAEDLVAAAMKAGKVTPAQKDCATEYARNDPKGFAVFVEKAPVVASPTATSTAAPPAGGGALDEAQKAVNSAMGITPEDWEKFGPGAKAQA